MIKLGFYYNFYCIIFILETFEKSSAVSQDYGGRINYLMNLGQLGIMGSSDEIKYGRLMTAFAQDEGDLASAHWTRFNLNMDIDKNSERALEELECSLKCSVPPKNYKSPSTFFQDLAPRVQELKAQIEEHKKSEEGKKEDEIEKQRKQFSRDLFHLKSPNPVAPALESFVQIKYNEKKGRHLVVTKDVEAGKSK